MMDNKYSVIDELIDIFNIDKHTNDEKNCSLNMDIPYLLVCGYVKTIANKAIDIPLELIKLCHLFYFVTTNNRYLYYIALSDDSDNKTFINAIDLFQSEQNKIYSFKINNLIAGCGKEDEIIPYSHTDGLYLISNYKFPEGMINSSRKYKESIDFQDSFKSKRYSAMIRICGKRGHKSESESDLYDDVDSDILVFEQPNPTKTDLIVNSYWFDLPTFPPENEGFICDPSLIQYGDELLVVGHLNNYNPNKIIYSLDMQNMKWRDFSKDINGYNELTDKCGSSLLIDNDKLFIMGGGLINDAQYKENIMIDLKYKNVVKLRDMNHFRAAEGCCLLDNNRIAIGGNTSDGDWRSNPKESIIEFYDMVKDIWIDYKYKTNKSHCESVVWCGDKTGNQNILMIGGDGITALQMDPTQTGYIEWCDIRENSKWRLLGNDKSIVSLFGYDNCYKEYISYGLCI